jgi:hypothetical protein
MTRRHRRKKSNTLQTMLGVALLVALLCFCIYAVANYLNKRSDESSDANVAENVNTAEYIIAEQNNSDGGDKNDNSNSGSEAKTEDLSDIKEAAEAAEQRPEVKKDENGLKVAQPKVTYAGIGGDGRLVISGEITNILDQAGICSFVIQNGEKSTTIEHGILPNAKNSVCDAINFEASSEDFAKIKSELGTGEWSVKIKYKSNYAEGESETIKFKVN